jgi:hypothetical protein
MTELTVAQIAKMISSLPPAPAHWTEAAQALPELRASLDELVERCRADQAARAAALEDLEQALRAAGVAPEPQVLRYMRLSLDE